MDQEGAVNRDNEATPIFAAFRRGYDPEQVDRYVNDQRRRLDEAVNRASEAERKLAAAVGQLRELHRRIAVLESEDRTSPTPAIDAIGERIQRILQEAWDSAYAMRQAAESDAAELRERAKQEAEEILAEARRKAQDLGSALERRREAFLRRVDVERSKAVAETTFLQEQRKLAVEELVRIRTRIDGTVGEFLGRPDAAPAVQPRSANEEPRETEADLRFLSREEPTTQPAPSSDTAPDSRPVTVVTPTRQPSPQPHAREHAPHRSHRPISPPLDTSELARTIPVHRLAGPDEPYEYDPSELVRQHRARRPEVAGPEEEAKPFRGPAGVFDFEEATAPSGDDQG